MFDSWPQRRIVLHLRTAPRRIDHDRPSPDTARAAAFDERWPQSVGLGASTGSGRDRCWRLIIQSAIRAPGGRHVHGILHHSGQPQKACPSRCRAPGYGEGAPEQRLTIAAIRKLARDAGLIGLAFADDRMRPPPERGGVAAVGAATRASATGCIWRKPDSELKPAALACDSAATQSRVGGEPVAPRLVAA